MAAFLVLILGIFVYFPHFGESRLGSAIPSKEDVNEVLLSELSVEDRPHNERFLQLEAAIRPMFTALPKNEYGNLGSAVVRYALHRLFVQRHGWFIRGLEPTADKEIAESPSEWVPAYLQGSLEKLHGAHGLTFPDLVILAASLEDMIHTEMTGQLETVFKMHEFDIKDQVNTQRFSSLYETYLTMYVSGANFSNNPTLQRIHLINNKLKEKSPLTQKWIEDMTRNATLAKTSEILDFSGVERILERSVEEYGPINEGECNGLKSTLLQLEDRKAGRIRLADFYKQGLSSYWVLDDKIEYLRSLGAVDESDPDSPLVIVPNYVGAWPQCLRASGLYGVCCKNECEDLMGSLERQIGAPKAHPDQVAEVVAKLSSDTIDAPRILPGTLLRRLRDVAAANGGQVVLHGRLFAQWMHHAFPRECPYPHGAGTATPLSADQWIAMTGHESTGLSLDEIKDYMSSAKNAGASVADTWEGDDEVAKALALEQERELPWTHVEELLAEDIFGPSAKTKGPHRDWTLGVSFGELLSMAVGLIALRWLVKAWNRMEIDTFRNARKMRLPMKDTTL